MAIFRTKTQQAMLGIFITFMFTLPLFLPLDWLSWLNRVFFTLIAIYGLNIITGYCGQISLGHAAFIGVGAYTAAILANKCGLAANGGWLLCILAGGAMAAIIGMIFGAPSLRVKGLYLALATLAAQFILIYIFIHMDVWLGVKWTGGWHGTEVERATLGSLVLNSDKELFYVLYIFAILATYAARNIARSRVGRAFVAVRDNDLAAEVMGINPFRYKTLAFATGSFFAGVAGALWAFYVGFITSEHFSLWHSIMYLAMIVVGGMGTTIGSIFGVVFLMLIENLTMYICPFLMGAFPALASNITAAVGPMIYGLVVLLFLVFEPRGLAHRWTIFKTYYRLWPFSY
jgi:branched-chain amino acid transport system permease protein